MNILKQIDKTLVTILKYITIICFIGLALIITTNIVARYVKICSLLWSDEIIELLFAYLVFYGSAALWISRGHFSAGDWIGTKLIKNPRYHHLYRLILEIAALGFIGFFFWFSLELNLRAIAVTNVLGISKRILYSCMPMSGIIMIIYSIRNIVSEIYGMAKPQHHNSLDLK